MSVDITRAHVQCDYRIEFETTDTSTSPMSVRASRRRLGIPGWVSSEPYSMQLIYSSAINRSQRSQCSAATAAAAAASII